jgi:polar amino acid transport system substrate-binding protein
LSAKIKELRDSGQLYQWQEKWFGFRMELPDSGYKAAGAI